MATDEPRDGFLGDGQLRGKLSGMSDSNPSFNEVLAKMRAESTQQNIQRIRDAAKLEGRTALDFAKAALLEETNEARINALQDVVAFLEREQAS